MSINQFYWKDVQIPPGPLPDVSATRNIKANYAYFNRVYSKDAAIGALTVDTINGRNINNIINGGADNMFLRMNGSTIQWQYFNLNAFAPTIGIAKSILSVNSLGSGAEWSRDLEINNIDITQEIKLAGILPLANQVLGTDALGQLGWQTNSPVIPPGANNSVYITNGLGVVGFSNTVITDNVTVTNQFNSPVANDLDNVNIISNMTVASIAPTPGQVLGTDVGNVLGWQTLAQEQKRAIYYCITSQDINFAVNTTLAYNVSYNNLAAEILQTAPSNFTCQVAGTYLIEADISVLPSASENEIQITNNATPQAYGFLNVVSSFACVRAILALNIGDIISVLSVRTNADPTPKLNLANPKSSPLVFTRLV